MLQVDATVLWFLVMNRQRAHNFREADALRSRSVPLSVVDSVGHVTMWARLTEMIEPHCTRLTSVIVSVAFILKRREAKMQFKRENLNEQ